MAEQAPTTTQRPSKRNAKNPRFLSVRGILFRLGAVAVGLLVVVCLELALGLVLPNRAAEQPDPFAGFDSIRPLFVLNDAKNRYEIARSRYEFFRPDSFSAEKSADGFRIFCLGGSTVQGRPYAIETSFTTWLRLALEAAEPGVDWEVVNCGGVSYASYRLVPILKETLGYEPDMIILCTGHNEFLEDRSYDHIKQLPEIVFRAGEFVSRLNTYALIRSALGRNTTQTKQESPPGRPILESETQAMLDYEGGLAQYHRDEKWRTDVVRHYRHSVQTMIELCQEAEVPLLLINPVENLRGTPPFKSEHRDDLTVEDRHRWESLWRQASKVFGTDQRRALELWQKAAEIDDQYAGLHYTLGQCYDTLGMIDEARQEYLLAKELDICPLRMIEPLHETLLDCARSSGTPLVDARQLIEIRSHDSIPGDEWFIDHVHPTIRGHQLIANELAAAVIEMESIEPKNGWEQARDEAYRRHYDSLDTLYFHQGMQRRKNLRRWAQGRSDATLPKPQAKKHRGDR